MLSSSSSLVVGRCDALMLTESAKYSATRNEYSCWGGSVVSRTAWGCSIGATVTWCRESKEELRDKVPDATVISSLSSIVVSSEQTDLAACECLDLSFTLLHQLWSDSLTLSATRAFLHRDPIWNHQTPKTELSNYSDQFMRVKLLLIFIHILTPLRSFKLEIPRVIWLKGICPVMCIGHIEFTRCAGYYLYFFSYSMMSLWHCTCV